MGRQIHRETVNYTALCKYWDRGRHRALGTLQGMGGTREGVLGTVILKPCFSAKVGINQLGTGKEALPKQRKHVQINGVVSPLGECGQWCA